MNQNDNANNEKAKEGFSAFWKKASDMGKKAAEGAKAFTEQTKKNIYEAQAKKYTSITAKEFKNKNFTVPNVIEIVDDSANRKFITDADAIGWIERHEDVDVLHMYSDFVKKCGLQFVPVPQRDNVYCKDNFDSGKFINSNQVFGKATEERLAELEHIAYCLGAISCSVEIVESDCDTKVCKAAVGGGSEVSMGKQSKTGKMQSGKTISQFQGHNTPKKPTLKWFTHDDNITQLIEMRCSDSNSIKSKILELKGSSCATMSRKVACAIDDVMHIKGNISMENQAIREHSNILVYEIEF